ncbi:uncharacterized protein LOC110694007 [Chenopodium quinoa]|uniref:uncharacterized protein LOC110694007 n=1 Tax=Chenopodium quinoa TaxID=63459 RepID=UPI000B78C03B|nr:uncharacterized protein LOC110694007 [Chenopodium quinoa]
MPNYTKFLKDILSGRRTCDVVETVNLTENCSEIILKKMPPKLKDPENFSISCDINKMQIDNVLSDLGASVSLMPYSIYQRLELGELMPSKITLQLVDRSIKIPKRKVEDVPLRVGKPFLAISSAMIDVKSAKISLKVGEEVIEFDLNESMKYPLSSMHENLLTSNDPLENVLLNKDKIGSPIKEMAMYEDLLNGSI